MMNLSSIGAPRRSRPYGHTELNEQLLANVNDCWGTLCFEILFDFVSSLFPFFSFFDHYIVYFLFKF